MLFLGISPCLPCQLDAISAALAANPENRVYMASLQRRPDSSISGVSNLVIRKASASNDTGKSPYAAMWLRALKARENALATYRAAAASGFLPDVVFFQAGHGIALNIRDVYPDAIFIAYADPFFSPLTADLHNLQFADADYRFVRLEEDRRSLPAVLASGSNCLPFFVDTEFFQPSSAGHKKEAAFFTEDLGEPELMEIWRLAVALLLHGYPTIRFVTRSRWQEKTLSGWRSRLDPKLGARIFIDYSPDRNSLAAILKQIQLAAFPRPTRRNFQDILAAMSCGVAVLTRPVFSFLRSGENIIAWQEGDLEQQFTHIRNLLSGTAILARIGMNSRNTVLTSHCQQKILPEHLQFLQSLAH